MAASFDAEVAGSPSSIRAAAEWLRHKAESAAKEADVIDGLIASTSYRYWQGRAGDAFSALVNDMVMASREVADYAGPFAETLHVYAGRVERMQEHFEGFLRHAADVGLTVSGLTVCAPVWVGAVPQSDHDETWEEWRGHQTRLREYERMQGDVVAWHGDHLAWVYSNLFTYAASLPAQSQAQIMNDRIRLAASLGFPAVNKYLDARWAQKIAALTSRAEGFAFASDEIVRRSTASGSPELRARLREAIANGTPASFDGVADRLGSVVEVTKTLRSVLDKVGGPLIDVGLGAWAIADGAEPVDVAVEWVGGLGASGVAGVVVAGATLPFWASATIVIGVGAAGSWAAGMIWESTPASWRHGIYEFTEDGFIIVGDVGENVGDWFVDRTIDIGQWFN